LQKLPTHARQHPDNWATAAIYLRLSLPGALLPMVRKRNKQKVTFIHSIKGQLLLYFLLPSLVPLVVVGYILYNRANSALQAEAFAKLEAAQQIKKGQIERYFTERQGDMAVLVETMNALRQEAFDKLDAVQTIKKREVENYFKELETQVKTLKSDPYTAKALADLIAAFESVGNKVTGSS
jgi:methyl-accepting chemotaxis protein